MFELRSASNVEMRLSCLIKDARFAFGLRREVRVTLAFGMRPATDARTWGPHLALERDLRVRGWNAGSASRRFTSEALSVVIF